MKRYKKNKTPSKPSKELIDYFPRGTSSKDDFSFNNAMIDHSKESKNLLSKKRKSKNESLQKLKIEKETKTEFEIKEKEKSRVMLPKFSKGDLVLLSISEIYKDYMICDYSRNKKAMIHSSYSGLNLNNEDSFNNYFSIGQFLIGAVINSGGDIQIENQGGRLNKKLLICIDPKIINTGLKVEKITVGMDLYGQLVLDNKGNFNADFKFSNDNDESESEESENEENEDEENEDEENEESESEEINTNKNKKKIKNKSNNDKNYIVKLIDTIDKDEDSSVVTNKKVGSYYFFKVIKINNNKDKKIEIIVSLNLQKYKFPIKTIDFSNIRPGFLFKGNITRILVNGSEISFGGNIGTIFIDHIKNEKKDKNIFVRVVHFSLKKKTCSLSSLDQIRTLTIENINDKQNLIGQRFNAKVIKILFGNSYLVELNKIDNNEDENNKKEKRKLKAFLHNSNLPKDLNLNYIKKQLRSQKKNKKKKKEKGKKKEEKKEDEEEEEEIENLIPEINIGQTFENVLIKEYNYFDDIPIITALNQKELLTYSSIKVGQFVQCKIKQINQDDIDIIINNFINGKIPLFHITDFPLKKLPKKFKVGMEINARIFSFNEQTKNLILTMKETLMDENIILHSNINDIKEGEEIYVIYLGNGLFSHSNNINGTLINSKTIIKKGEFTIGNLYKYKVFRINYSNGKMYLTKENQIYFPSCGDYDNIMRRNPLINNIITVMNTLDKDFIDEINEGDVKEFSLVKIDSLVKSLNKRGVDNKIINENKEAFNNEFLLGKLIVDKKKNNKGNYYAFISKEHCGDYFFEDIFKKMYEEEEGDNIEMLVLYHDKKNRILFTTMKQSLIDNKDNILHINENIKKINEQQFIDGKIYYGFVNKVTEKGINLQFYGKKKILMKTKQINNNYKPGQTVICKYNNGTFYFDIKVYSDFKENDLIKESNIRSKYEIEELKKIKGISDETSKTKIILNKEYKVKIEKIEENYIISKYKDCEVRIISSLFNFSLLYNKVFNFNDYFKNGNEINVKIISNIKDLNFYVGQIPQEIISKIFNFSDKNNNKSLSKKIGDTVNCLINSIKKDHIFFFCDNRVLGRMEIKSFPGNIDRISKLLNETINLRKNSSDSKSSLNNVSELKMKNKIVRILNVETKKKKKIQLYELAPIEDEDLINEKGINEYLTNEEISNDLDKTNKKENIGIISMIKPFTKLPITLCINNDLIEEKLQIPFNKIPIEMISEEGLKYKIGNKIKFYCDKKLNCSLIKNTENEISIGKIYPARILKSIDGRGLIIDLNISKEIETFVDICEITDFLHYNPLEYYKKGQIVKCRILSKDENSNRYYCSLRNSIIDNDDYDIIINGSTLKFLQRFSSLNSCDLRNKILKFGAKDSIELNTIAIGYITSSSEKGIFIKLANNVIVRASLRELTDEISISKPYLLFNINNICICRVISIYEKNNERKINVSLRESVIKYGLIISAKNLVANNFYNCEILSQSKKGFEVNIIGSTFIGLLSNENIKLGSKIEIGNNIILQLIKYEKEENNTNGNKYKLNFSNLNIDETFNKSIIINPITEEMIKKGEENMELYQNIKQIIENAKKEKNINDLIDMTGNGINENEIDYEELVEKAKKRKNSTNSKLSKNSSNQNKIISEDEVEEQEEEENISNIEDNENILLKEKNVIIDVNEKNKLLSGIGKNESDMEIEKEKDKEENDEEEKTTKKKSAKEREKEKIKKELNLRNKEQEKTEEINAEYYEKLILSEHDNSLYWIQYASYILDNLGLESARKIFERAIKTIDISKQKEKLNIWIGYINLENIYGNENTLKSVVERALQVNDKKQIYLQLIRIYTNSKKYIIAYEIYKICIKDYFNDFEIWKKYLEFLFEINYAIKLQNKDDIPDTKTGLRRAMQILSEKKQIDITIYYAQLLYAYDNIEEGRNTFDNIVKEYPKRKDIWFVYIDKEIKYSKNVEKIRKIFERMFNIPFKLSSLKSIFKKYLEFEQTNGEKALENAKNKVQEIMNSKMEVEEEGDNNENGNEE